MEKKTTSTDPEKSEPPGSSNKNRRNGYSQYFGSTGDPTFGKPNNKDVRGSREKRPR